MERHRTRSRRFFWGSFLIFAIGALVAPSLGVATLPGRNGKLYFTLFTQRGTGTQIAWIDVTRPGQVHRVPWHVGAGTLGWSPDGRRIAYQSPLGLFVANVDGRHRKQLTRADPRQQTFDGDPAWSPDGRWIAFAHEVPMHPTIQLIRPNGTGRRTLTNGEVPSWSRDGRELAFQAGEVGALHVFLIRRDGSGRRQITRSPGSDSLPEWSPDGRHVVFVHERSDQPRVASIYLVDAKSGRPAQPLTRQSTYDTTPGWSPDGRWVVFSRGRPLAKFGLFLIHPDGGGLRRLTAAELNVQVPRWQPLPARRR
jgi:Tol biopolymer transport system component